MTTLDLGPGNRPRPATGDIARFTVAERALHWAFAVLLLTCALTGLVLYVGPLTAAVGRRETVRFLYFVDERDPWVADPDEEIPVCEMPNSLTVAMLRHGQPMLGPSAQIGAVRTGHTGMSWTMRSSSTSGSRRGSTRTVATFSWGARLIPAR